MRLNPEWENLSTYIWFLLLVSILVEPLWAQGWVGSWWVQNVPEFFFLKKGLVFGNVGISTVWACEILQEVVLSHPSNVNGQNLPGNGDGLELPAAFRHCLRHSVSFSTDSQVVTCILHVAAWGRFRWFSGYLTLSPTFKLIQGEFLLQVRGCLTSPSWAIS